MYYYRFNGSNFAFEPKTVDDDWVKANGSTPKIVFEKKNSIKIWWHKNDVTGEVDMNINLADLGIRKRKLAT